jgi:NAD(P)H-flavin reductase
MIQPTTENVYIPKKAVIDRIVDEITDVKTFYWHFKDPKDQAEFKKFKPGMFAQLTLFGVGEFVLSLPPSPFEKETFFTCRQVGVCSRALHKMKPGDEFAVRGPFGNGFPMQEYYGRNLVIVAGGIGLIPLRSVIISALAEREKYKSIQIFYGSKSPTELMYVNDLKTWEKAAAETYLTVDKGAEGWKGNVGNVGSLFRLPGVKIPVENTTAFVCGPPIMFRFVLKDLMELGLQPKNIVSTMERYMKCAVGKCGHCCIGSAYVCVDGPVFTYDQVLRLGEGI